MQTAASTVHALNKQVKRRFFRSKRKLVRNGIIIGNVLLVVGVVTFIFYTRNAEPGAAAPTLNFAKEQEITDPLDELSGADIAVNIAALVQMDQATSVRNNADSVNTTLDIVPSGSQVIAKPQIVETDLKSIQDLVTYKVKEGETVISIAKDFGISADTIRWSNDLTGDTINEGAKIKIPPVNGILYTVKRGETAKSLAEKYGSSEAVIIAFNDAEIDGIKDGQEIVIPNGEVPVVQRFTPALASGFRFGSSAVYGYNGYSFGYCTWHASSRRAAAGKPIPANLGNASTWKVRAQLSGLSVGSEPQKNAVLWHPPRDYYGHVAFVEEVYADGSILVSDMNYPIWNGVTTRKLSPAQAAAYQYIY